MNLTAKITRVSRDRIVKSGEEFLDVDVEVSKDGELLDVKKLGFPVEATKEEIAKAIEKMLSTLTDEMERSEVQQKEESVNEHAEKLVEEVVGLEIKL